MPGKVLRAQEGQRGCEQVLMEKDGSTWGRDEKRPAGGPFFRKVVLLNEDQPAGPRGRQNGETQLTGLSLAGGLISI